MKTKYKILIGAAIVLPVIYLFAAYTSIKPISTLRDLYIETAMSTMTHQYLAKIFPQSVIDKAMEQTEQQFEQNKIAKSTPLDQYKTSQNLFDRYIKQENQAHAWHEFQTMFPEIDIQTMQEHIRPDELQTLDIEDPEFDIKTIHGDRVYAINVPEQILIINLKTAEYNGMLAISKQPENTILGKNTNKKRGSTVTELCEQYNAILGINASGFYDPNGRGAGNTPVGLVLSQGELSGTRMYDRYQIAGMDLNHNFVAGYDLDLNNMRDAIQFYPILISENKNLADGSFGMGIQPRSCIGQNLRGDMMFLIIDGRQIGHSIGITVPECAEILMRYDCYIAMNMDGGSSASMTYKGKMITRTSSPKSDGRNLPDAWLVLSENNNNESETENHD